MPATYPFDARIHVPAFTHRVDGDEVILADRSGVTFLSIPPEGLELLTWLQEGLTVAEADARFEQRHGQSPDLPDFLDALAGAGFPVSVAGSAVAEPDAHTETLYRSWTFNWISPAVAARLCGPAALSVCGLLIVLGAAAIVTEPGVLPPTSTLFFEGQPFAVLVLLTALITLTAVFVHEVGHAVVARARDIPVTFGIGHLMYQVVAQTDITGIWMAPRRTRYLAFVYGTVIDAASASVLLMALWSERRGYLSMPSFVSTLIAAAVLTYGFRMSFQVLFYLRTDGYYLVLVATRSKNLMADTEQYLRNIVLRAIRRPRFITPQTHLRRRDRRVIRAYAVLWIAGRVFEIALLFTVFLPLLIGYAAHLVELFAEGDTTTGVIDFLTVAGLVYLFDGIGLWMWLRSLGRIWRRRLRLIRSTPDSVAERVPEPVPESGSH